MDVNRIQQKFTQTEQVVHRAAQACRDDAGAPSELKESMGTLDAQTKQAHELILHPDDEQAIVRCIDELEEMGDRAKKAVQNYGSANPDLKIAVMEAHQQLSELKRQVH